MIVNWSWNDKPFCRSAAEPELGDDLVAVPPPLEESWPYKGNSAR
jgi:hypothetical protein